MVRAGPSSQRSWLQEFAGRAKIGEDSKVFSALPASGPFLLGENIFCLKKEGTQIIPRMI